MLGTKKTNAILATALLVAIAAVGCGDDDGGGGGATGGGTATITKDEAIAGACDSDRADEDKTCTGTNEYVSCLETTCADGYKMCLGENYKTGDYTGSPCASWLSCLDTATDKCTCTQDSACVTCLASNVGSCAATSGCTAPTCMDAMAPAAGTGGGAGAGGGGLTCDQVLACCNQLSGEEMTNCVTQVNQIKAGGDAVCAAAGQVICSAVGGG